jgi:hypothetical protein
MDTKREGRTRADDARRSAVGEDQLEQAKTRLAAVDREVSLMLSRLKEMELGLDVGPLVE